MLKNYFKVAWRNLLRSKGHTLINVGGLAAGMTLTILIGLWVYDELNYDTYGTNTSCVARVMQQQTTNGVVGTFDAQPYPLGNELRTVYGNNFKYVAMASWEGDHILSIGGKHLLKNGMYIEKDGPKIFDLKMVAGSRGGLSDMHSVLLCASVAKALFNDSDPINKVVRLDNSQDVKVTGVYEDLPSNFTMHSVSFMAPWELYVSMEQWIQNARDNQYWDNNSFQTFVEIADNTTFEAVNRNILDSKQLRVNEDEKKYQSKIFLHPIRNWHLRSHWDNTGHQSGGAIEYVWLFSIVGIFVLLLACINFMNLSTARSEKRAKEVGIRKSIGSLRGQLIAQFYSESLVVVFLAFIISIGLTLFALPWFNQLANKEMHMPFGKTLFWMAGFGFTIITAVIAGSYPALYLSSFNPVKVLKGTFRAGRYEALPRKMLVVLQFTISLALIIGTIIVYSQIQYARNRPIGYDRSGLLMVNMKTPDYYGKYDVFRHELVETGAIKAMAYSSSPVTDVWSNNDGFTWPGKDPSLDADFATTWVTHDFGKAVGWSFLEGRDFSREYPTDSFGVVLNEKAVQFMNLKDPLGKTVRFNAKDYHVIGIISDMLMGSPYAPVKQAVFFLDYNNVNFMVFKLDPQKSARESLAKIEAAFKKYIPAAPFDYKFADNEFSAKFAAEERIGQLATFFAALAIFISCLGLFGLTSFVAEQRKKEIGVRKVLGATVLNVWRLLSTEFLALVTISLLIAVPLSYYFMNMWLLNYEYRTDISWWIFVVAGIGALLITILTVSFQAIKAAVANPVKSLRTE